MKIVKWLLSSRIGLAITLGLLLVGAASAAQFYYFEKPVLEKKEAMKAGSILLERAADHLEEASKENTKWPARTSWFPTDLPCGAETEMHVIPPWDTLGFEDKSKTRFQYRLDTHEKGYILRARTDSDCDGIFAIYTIEGSTDWTSTFRRKFQSQNKKE